MGIGRSRAEPVAMEIVENTPDTSLSADVNTPEENARKRKQYAHLKSAAVQAKQRNKNKEKSAVAAGAASNVIEDVYNEDFDTIDHAQAMRFPPMVAAQLKTAVRDEAERRCTELEKTMARCLQDKMWTSWKCQKERDTYYHCVQDEERKNVNPNPEDPSFVDLLTAYRWKYNLGTFHGEIIGRNNLMRQLWKEHFPDRDLPHPWVKDES